MTSCLEDAIDLSWLVAACSTKPTVTSWVLGQVLLVILLCKVVWVLLGVGNLSGYLAISFGTQLGLEGVAGGLRQLSLFVVVVEDASAVLGASVVSLSVYLGGIMVGPEDMEELLVRDLLWVEDHLNHLSVVGVAGADVFVRWVKRATSNVSNRGTNNAALLPELPFCAPKATQTKASELLSITDLVDGSVQNMMGKRRGGHHRS